MLDIITTLVLAGLLAGAWYLNANRHNNSPLKQKGTSPLLIIVKWALLTAAACFGSIYAYNIFSPISPILGLIAAFIVIWINYAESYLIRFTIAGLRHGFTKLAIISGLGVFVIFIYSLTAGTSVINTLLSKNADIQLAAQYKIAASKDNIEAAQAGILEATLKAQKTSPYDYLSNPEIAKARQNAATLSAQENLKIAAVLETKAPEFKSAFDMTMDAVAFLISLALEISIIGITAFIEIFQSPTPLPALVRFNNKLLDWNINPNATANLNLITSPALGTISAPTDTPRLSFAGYGWDTKTPKQAQATPSSNSAYTQDPVRVHTTTGTPDSVRTLAQDSPTPSSIIDDYLMSTVYPVWVIKVLNGEIAATTRPAKALMSEYMCRGNLKETITPQAMQDFFNNRWIPKGLKDGAIIPNKDGGVGKAAYIANPNYPKV